MQPVVCPSQEAFNKICGTLSQFKDGRVDHERLIINEDGTLSLGPKSCWLFRVIQWIRRFLFTQQHPAEPISEFVITFFQSNSKFIKTAEHISALYCINKIRHRYPLDEANPKRINALVASFSEETARSREQEVALNCERRLQECQAEIKRQTEEATRQNRKLAEEAEAKQRKFVEEMDAKNKANQQAAQAESDRIKQQIKRLQDEAEAASKALETMKAFLHEREEQPIEIRCKDGIIPNVKAKLLKDIFYFQTQLSWAERGQQIARGEKEVKANAAPAPLPGLDVEHESPSTKKLHADLTLFPIHVVKLYLNILADGEKAIKEVGIGELIELHRLAEYTFQDTENRIAKVFSDHLPTFLQQPNHVDALLQLLSTDFATPFVKMAKSQLIKHWHTLVEHPAFTQIKHEYLIEIVNQEVDFILDEDIFKGVNKWVDAIAKKTESSPLEVWVAKKSLDGKLSLADVGRLSPNFLQSLQKVTQSAPVGQIHETHVWEGRNVPKTKLKWTGVLAADLFGAATGKFFMSPLSNKDGIRKIRCFFKKSPPHHTSPMGDNAALGVDIHGSQKDFKLDIQFGNGVLQKFEDLTFKTSEVIGNMRRVYIRFCELKNTVTDGTIPVTFTVRYD